MSVTYTNRKGRIYYLCRGTTKTGKPRYFFAHEPKGALVEEVPAGYRIEESVNGIVSLSRIRPNLLLDEDVAAVRAALQAHPRAGRYRIDVKPERITIYEHVGPDPMELAASLAEDFGLTLDRGTVQRLQAEERVHGQFTPMMRFVLTNTSMHLFTAQRMCFRGGIDDWIDIRYDRPIGELAAALIPTLGTEEFFELF
jgi:hypothetical protein